jgi:general secretion pathway protein H
MRLWRRTHPGNLRSAGFTLIELVIVVMIAAVMTGIAVGRYGQALARYRADSAARRIVADLALARSEAKTTGSNVTVSFDPVSNQYQISTIPGLNNAASGYSVALGETPYHSSLVSAVLGGDAAVVFNGHGVPDSGGTVVVQSGATERTVSLSADTGRATIP